MVEYFSVLDCGPNSPRQRAERFRSPVCLAAVPIGATAPLLDREKGFESFAWIHISHGCNYAKSRQPKIQSGDMVPDLKRSPNFRATESHSLRSRRVRASSNSNVSEASRFASLNLSKPGRFAYTTHLSKIAFAAIIDRLWTGANK